MFDLARLKPSASLIAAMVFVCAFWTSAEASEWRINFREVASVSGEVVVLGDMAEPDGGIPADYWARLAKVELFAAPGTDAPALTMTRDELMPLLKARLGDWASVCAVPWQVRVVRGERMIYASEIKRRVVEFLTPKFAGAGGKVEFREFRLPGHIALKNAGDRLVVEAPAGVDPGKITLRLVVIGTDGRKYRSISASVFADMWMTAPCAARPLNRGDALRPEDITWERKNAAYISGEPYDPGMGIMRVKRPVGVGQVLTSRNLEIMPVVSEGSTVTLVYEGQRFTLAVPARALEDGTTGQSIPVENLQTEVRVTATVRDSQTVVVR